MFDLEITWDRFAQLNSQKINCRDKNNVLQVRISPRNLPSLSLRRAIALNTSQPINITGFTAMVNY
jgi:hypothetical protein